jgi:hypothetical protein
MTTDVSQDRRVTVLNQGSNRPAFTEGSRPYWALPSPVYERSGYRASRPTGYKVMRSSCIVILGPVASCLARQRNRTRCRRRILAPSSLRSRPLTRRLRRWPTASLDRTSPRRQRPPPNKQCSLDNSLPIQGSAGTTGIPRAMVLRLIRALPGDRLSNAHIFCCRDRQRLILLRVAWLRRMVL